MLRTAASENSFEWEDHLRLLCTAYNSSVHPTTGYTPFYLMFGCNTRMPIDLMYGSCPTEVNQPSNANEFVAKLQDRLQKAYTRVRDTMVHQLDRQKELYDERIHGKPLKRDDLVWLHSKVIPRGVGRKLHRPWTGPFRVVKRLSDSVYRLQNSSSSRHQLTVHFNRLKLCPEGIQLPTVLKQKRQLPQTPPQTVNPPGTNLTEIYDYDPALNPERRYPCHNRSPPERLGILVSHGT